jgi:octaprenyl-diphosphate synthase
MQVEVKASNSSEQIDINQVLNLVENDMQEVNATIMANLDSQVPLVNQLGLYIIESGGKRLRPVVLLLAQRACAGSVNSEENVKSAALLAAVVEFIHTATLLHDDVVDESDKRRGRDTANEVFGNAASVLVGDYLYSRAFQMMVTLGDVKVMDILSSTSNKIAEGEVMQLINCGSADTSEQQYIQTIQSKTAILFKAATQLGAVVNQQVDEVESALADYGMYLGTAFQLMDDILDYTADAEVMGKNVGDDLAEGKPTLPIIHAIRNSAGDEKDILVDAIENASRENLESVLNIIAKTDALNYTHSVAERQIDLAKQSLAGLKDSQYKQALLDLADFSIKRDH